jgi:N-acetylneuraminic acid mutarotase
MAGFWLGFKSLRNIFNPQVNRSYQKKGVGMNLKRVRFLVVCIPSVSLLLIFSCSKSKSPTKSNEADPTTGWTEKMSMPNARFGIAVQAYNNKVFVFGGTNAYSLQNETTEYNPVTDSWTAKMSIPTARVLPAANVVDNKIYVIGGTQFTYFNEVLSTVEEYEPVTNSWVTKADMPTPRGAVVSGVVDGKIYIISGRTGPETSDSQIEKTNVVEMYDPASNTWTVKASIPTARAHGCGVVVNGKIYVIGGELFERGQVVEVYDTTTDSWSQKANLPGGGRIEATASVVNGKIYVIGGAVTGGAAGTSTVFEYDPTADSWTTNSSMPESRVALQSATVNNKIYTFGGATGPWPYTALSTVYEYDPSLDSSNYIALNRPYLTVFNRIKRDTRGIPI